MNGDLGSCPFDVTALQHPELQVLHLEWGFREDDSRPVCEALGGSGSWLRSWTLCCVTAGKTLNLSEPPLPHFSVGIRIRVIL